MIGGLVGLAGGIATTTYTHHLERVEHRTEMRERSYYRLLGLKVTFIQANIRFLELSTQANALGAEMSFTKDPETHRQQNQAAEQANRSIDHLVEQKRDLLEACGEAIVAFPGDDYLKKLVSRLEKGGLSINPCAFVGSKSIAEIEATLKASPDTMEATVREKLDEPIQTVIDEIASQLRKGDS